MTSATTPYLSSSDAAPPATANAATPDVPFASLPASLAELPPAVVRPVQWSRLLLHLKRLRAGDPAHVLDSAYSVGDSIGGMSDERHLQRLWRSPRGRALIASRSNLAAALADREALRAMAPGSLGRTFLAFAERHGIDVLALLESEHAMSRDYAQLDPIRQWLSDRLTVMHDLWHILTGYDATPPGESALMGFSLPQRANDRALPIFIAMSVVAGNMSATNAWEAIRRGRRAVYLPEERFEELLPLPLDEVRRRLRIEPPRVAHPGTVTEGMLVPEAVSA